MKKITFIILVIFSQSIFSQTKMRPIEELINETDSGWPFVTEWIKSAKNKIEILSVDKQKAKDALYKTQVTTRSPMGSIIYETGGILIDNGWIRILGSGNVKLNRSLPEWNLGKGFKEFIPLTPEALVAMNPDFLLFFESGIQSIGGMDGVKNIRGIENTSAFSKNQIISMDGQYLSGFGPRVGKAALELAKAVRK